YCLSFVCPARASLRTRYSLHLGQPARTRSCTRVDSLFYNDTSFLATDLFRLWPLPSLNLTKSIHHQAPICKYYIYIDCTSSRNIFSNCFHQPTMSITTIPDLCRLMIFEQLPPKDL